MRELAIIALSGAFGGSVAAALVTPRLFRRYPVSSQRVEHRKGMVMVYDERDCYLGCMGRKTWEQLLRESA